MNKITTLSILRWVLRSAPWAAARLPVELAVAGVVGACGQPVGPHDPGAVADPH